jgi:hypothetical protein
MEHYRPHKPSSSRVIVNGSSSPTNSTVLSRTRSRQRTEYGSTGNQPNKDNTKTLDNSWHSPNHSTTNYLNSPVNHSLSPPHPGAVHSFGIGVTPSTSASNVIHNSLQSPAGLHQGLNSLACQQANSSHVFGGKSVFGSPSTQLKIASHRNADNEEAMDIDGQEDMDTGHTSAVCATTAVDRLEPVASQSRTLRVHNTASTSSIGESPKVMFLPFFIILTIFLAGSSISS